MEDFTVFARDFGLKPQGKAAPMSQSKSENRDRPMFENLYSSKPDSSFSDFDYDSMFKASEAVHDKVVYDEDVFGGLPGVGAKSGIRYDENENVFATMVDEKRDGDENRGDVFDDLLGNLGGREELESKSSKSLNGFDDLLPGFGSMSSQNSRLGSMSSKSQKTSINSDIPSSSVMDDPFAVLESTSVPVNSSPKVFSDPLDEISKLSNSASTKTNNSSAGAVVFDYIDPLDGLRNSAPAYSSETIKEAAPSDAGSNGDRTQSKIENDSIGNSSFGDSTSQSQKIHDNKFPETMFEMPSISTESQKSLGQKQSPPYANVEFNELNSHPVLSPSSHLNSSDDAWLSVSEIPLLTQPTRAPPPSRPPPPIPRRPLRSEAGFYHSNAGEKGNNFSPSPSYSQSPKPSYPPVSSNMASPIDELDDTHGRQEMDPNSSAAASAAVMKEAVDRAEAKFKHAKEVREREYAKTARYREPAEAELNEQVIAEEREREYEERLEREQRQRDEEERERRRLEREIERSREEREKARQAVERATREARDRAAVEARDRAAAETRRKSERAAVQRAQAEARERAATGAKEKAEKSAAEARERATAEVRETVKAEAREKAAANAKAEAEARRRADRAAVDRAAAEARERAASAAWLNQQKNDSAKMNQQQRDDNDLESFFSMNSRPSSVPRPRTNSSDPTVNPLFQSNAGSQETKRTSSVNASSNMKKTSSAPNFVDDLSSIFGGSASASSGDFREVNGETEERRRARLDRHQRTQERAAQALAEKNQRDLQTQRDQEERHRISATLDVEIKRWAAGKEGNLRALLSTMQYVLWPECGWTPVSLTDLITGASVKKAYRKATLCIHPDKVQQKGANLQQKYIAEKVFDLLKEAWNKFNSEELF